LKSEVNLFIFLTKRIFEKLKIKKHSQELKDYIKRNISEKELTSFRKRKNENQYLKNLSFKISNLTSFFEETYKDFVMNKKALEFEEKSKIYEEFSKSKELDLKFALSKLFKKKQREILGKILSEKRLTKTEYEYYIRIIKKKLDAIIQLKEIAETVLRKKAKRS